MPLMKLVCNTTHEPADSQDFLKLASKTTAEILGKSENYVMCVMDENKPMSFAGTTEPAAYIEFKSIGLPEDKTGDLSQAICQIVATKLGISPERTYIEFNNAPRHMWGWNNRTF